MNIKNFNTNDLIVRTEPGKGQQEIENETLGITTMVTLFEDTSYIGQPMRLIDVCNGMIYTEMIGQPVCLDKKRQMPLHTFTDGWDYFVVPNGYTMEEIEQTKII